MIQERLSPSRKERKARFNHLSRRGAETQREPIEQWG